MSFSSLKWNSYYLWICSQISSNSLNKNSRTSTENVCEQWYITETNKITFFRWLELILIFSTCSLTTISFLLNICNMFLWSPLNNLKKRILKCISSKWTIYEDFKDWIGALAEQIFTVKTSKRSQMNPKICLYNTAFSAQLPCLDKHSVHVLKF